MGKIMVDIEEYAATKKEKPRENVIYKYRVDKTFYESEKAELSREEILTVANLEPVKYELYIYINNTREKLSALQIVNLAEPGVERFSTVPLQMTEG